MMLFARPGFRVALRIFGHWLSVGMVLAGRGPTHAPSQPRSRSRPS